MARTKHRGRPAARATTAAPRLTAAAITLVSDVDRVKARVAKLAKRLEVSVPNQAADTAPSTSLSGAIAGASASITAVNELLNHIDEQV